MAQPLCACDQPMASEQQRNFAFEASRLCYKFKTAESFDPFDLTFLCTAPPTTINKITELCAQARDSPSTRVFKTYELLENILLHLPLRTLLLSQRVNKSFQDVICRSQKIKQALFLEPCSPHVVVEGLVDNVIKHSSGGSATFRFKAWMLEAGVLHVTPAVNPFLAS
ncbi:Putative F-box domain-containing protein [Septoria linicola]|uniref:F-box domain-containing protein n=1 Tax=Septoria linicola TaxID=215465 RepID=A0A9Q9AQ68_9PEZI|nr:Putative F-box domain-containing protein [Septoria linicola]